MKISYEYVENYGDFRLQVLCSISGQLWTAKIYHSYNSGDTWTLTTSTLWDSDFHRVIRLGRELLFERFRDTVAWDDDHFAALVKKRNLEDWQRWE